MANRGTGKEKKRRRADENWLHAEALIDVASGNRERMLSHAMALQADLRTFAREYGRRVSEFKVVKVGDSLRVVALFRSRVPERGVSYRTYQPQRERTFRIRVAYKRKQKKG